MKTKLLLIGLCMLLIIPNVHALLLSYNAVTSIESDPLSLHLTQDNWFIDGDALSWDNNNTLTFDDTLLQTTYYNVSSIGVIRGTASGVLSDINSYDGVSYNVTEVSGAVGLDIRFNFTGVEDFNQVIFRYKTSTAESHISTVQIYDYDDSEWESYGSESLIEEYGIFVFPVFDSSEHISGGVVQMRVYSPDNGNTNHVHYFDWVAISDGIATPSGAETDPFSIHKDAINETDFVYDEVLSLNKTDFKLPSLNITTEFNNSGSLTHLIDFMHGLYIAGNSTHGCLVGDGKICVRLTT